MTEQTQDEDLELVDPDEAPEAPGRHSEAPGFGVTRKFPVPDDGQADFDPTGVPDDDEDLEDDDA